MNEFQSQTWRTRGALGIEVAPPEGLPTGTTPVIQIACTFGRGLDVNMQNARLIAEAPAMYRFLLKHAEEQEVKEILSRINGEE